MNRRSFLSSCLALAAAPAIVRADSLMKIVPRSLIVYPPETLAFFQQDIFIDQMRNFRAEVLQELMVWWDTQIDRVVYTTLTSGVLVPEPDAPSIVIEDPSLHRLLPDECHSVVVPKQYHIRNTRQV